MELSKLEQKKMQKLGQISIAQDRFVKVFQGVYGVGEEEARQMFEVESFTFKKQATEIAGFEECTDISITMTFLAVVSNGLTFNNSQKLVYLMTRNVKVGDNKFEKQLVYQTTPDGKIYLCQKAGSVKDVSKPVIVYEGDTIEVSYNHVTYSPKIPRNEKIIGGFCTVTHNDGRQEVIWVDIKDIETNRKASEKQNRGTANALYTSNNNQIDPGFFSSKIINAALKNKAKKATYSEMEVQEEEVTQNYYVDADAVVRTVAPQDSAQGTDNQEATQDNQEATQEYAF